MKIVFLSNYFTHHQIDLSNELFERCGGEYIFIETEPMEQERKNGGWDITNFPTYVFHAYDSKEAQKEAIELCTNCDILITGSAPDFYFKKRLREKKLTFKYGERFFKTPFTWRNLLHRVASMWRHVIPYQNKNHYLLCASAYMPADCALFNCFPNRCFKWGYFPEVKRYDSVDTLIQDKKKNSLLWAARFIDWKHPEIPVEIARRLKADGYDFELTMIGSGELVPNIENLIAKYQLEGTVRLLGSMPPEQVRTHMEQSEIFLFTSDRQEGWGAVLNESMNSGCAVIANRAIGSVPFLIKDGENGLIYEDGDIDGLYQKVKGLMDHPEERKYMGKLAYLTMTEQWNASVAAQRLLELIECIRAGANPTALFENDVCSLA